MQEIWKDIKGYEGIYKVSNFGNVLSVICGPKTNSVHLKKKSKILSPVPTNFGYYKVELYKNGIGKIFYVHRLVAQAFIPNPECKPQVNHIDGNKANNNVCNLEWVTASENQKHSISLCLKKSSPNIGRIGSLNPSSKTILQYDLNGNFVKKWVGVSEAARKMGCGCSSISACLVGRHKTCKGYIWKYAEE